MFCKNCGTQLPNDAVFCYKCAQPTNSPHQARTPQPQVVVHPPANTTQPRVAEHAPAKIVVVKKSSGFGAAFFTVLLLICGIVGFSLYQKYHRETILNVPGFGKITKDQDNFYISGDTDTKSNPTSNTRSSQQTQSSASQTFNSGNQSSIAQVCSVSNNGKSVNIRTNCDTHDCYNDDATVGGTVADGTEVNVLNLNNIQSGHSFVWMPIQVTNGIGWIASSKLSCGDD